MTTIEILKGARALIEKGWCQGRYATDTNGAPASERSDNAVCFCISGALFRLGAGAGAPASYAVRAAIDYAYLVAWNDKRGRTKEQVLAAFDKAIAAESAKVEA